ncbi:hypothetical protein BJ742DRAFT_738535 [Cladochytrium replicatum]|nr:hypothetical protein BJ742DRAFT_738535 [Cladochytrium replicatum]
MTSAVEGSIAATRSTTTGVRVWFHGLSGTAIQTPLSGRNIEAAAPRLEHGAENHFLGNGRFHLEAMMIANPGVPAFRYDPYAKRLTKETYEFDEMRTLRKSAVDVGMPAKSWGNYARNIGSTRKDHIEAFSIRRYSKFYDIAVRAFPFKACPVWQFDRPLGKPSIWYNRFTLHYSLPTRLWLPSMSHLWMRRMKMGLKILWISTRET